MTFDPPLFLIGTIFGLAVGYGVQQWRIIRLEALRRAEQAAYKASTADLLLRHNRLQERHDRLYDSGRTRPLSSRDTPPTPKRDYVGAGRPVIDAPPRVIAQGDSQLYSRRGGPVPPTPPSTLMGEKPSSSADSFVLGMMVGGAIAPGSEPSKAVDTSDHHSAPSYDSGSSDSGSSSSSGSDSGGGGSE